jgi:hypothetical protein
VAERPRSAAAAAPAAPSPAPLTGFVVELYFPMTKTILPESFPTEVQAVRHAIAHMEAFPKGFAQIREAQSSRVILNHQQIYLRCQEQLKSRR